MIQIQINLKGYFKIAPYELEVVNIKRTHITTLIFVFLISVSRVWKQNCFYLKLKLKSVM